ncbi:hypothetical protein OROHE_015496 [Orobanche hederae]
MVATNGGGIFVVFVVFCLLFILLFVVSVLLLRLCELSTPLVELWFSRYGSSLLRWWSIFDFVVLCIYIGDDKVVHFSQHQNPTSAPFCSSSSSVGKMAAISCSDFAECGLIKSHEIGVIKSCLNCFLGDGSLYRYQYAVNGLTLATKIRGGTCTTAKSDPREDVIHRAMYLLENGYGEYDVVSNNCEDFALYCKTGLVISRRGGRHDQGNCSGQVSSVVFVPLSMILSLTSKIFSSNPLVYGATTVGTHVFGRYASDVGVRDDVSKVAVEEIAAHCHNLPAEEDRR